MVRREQMAPVVWGNSVPEFGGEVVEGSLVNVIVQVLVTMGEWERVGMLKDVPGMGNSMERVAGHVLKAGQGVKPAV